MKKQEKNCGHINEGWGKKYHHDYECFRQWQVIKLIEDFFNFVHGNSNPVNSPAYGAFISDANWAKIIEWKKNKILEIESMGEKNER